MTIPELHFQAAMVIDAEQNGDSRAMEIYWRLAQRFGILPARARAIVYAMAGVKVPQ
jgi:hypothetical protein